MTPGLESEPRSGVQWIQRGLPSRISGSEILFELSEFEFECELDWEWVRVADWVSQDILAVTPMPWASASRRPSRTCEGPPMRSMSRDWERPGMRSAAEVKIMRREG